MDNVDLARIQFATTSIYHFLFVPITIGLAFLVAILQTIWYRNGDPNLKRLCRMFGTLLLINIAIGVVTGLVQEFEFGMNWSTYSRFVGDVFGAPLAMEGLAAFFLESTFLGLWIFGWDRLPKKIHLACIWLIAFGTSLSAAFIMAANSWMQRPVGYAINAATGRPELNNILALFTSPVFLWSYAHILLAALLTGSVLMLSVSAWHLRRDPESPSFMRTARMSLIILAPATVAMLFIGSELGVVENQYQPMKIAAAEAQWNTCQPCSFSLFQIGGGKNDENPTKIIAIPHLLSLLATNSWNGQVTGMNETQAKYEQQYGPGNYVPNVFLQYWSMRVMAYIAGLLLLFVLWGSWLLHKKRLAQSKLFLVVATWAVVTPFIMNTAGWFLTENGRQPWIVQGLQKTSDAVSPSVSATSIWISITVFVAIYAVLGFIDLMLMLRYSRMGLAAGDSHGTDSEDPSDSALVY